MGPNPFHANRFGDVARFGDASCFGNSFISEWFGPIKI